ncbi:MAG: hypothetical protein EXR33_03630 [Betaproteobacteria bacterium]|nr:hypothetical protein [Betaproteobacteria bacterium]
MGLAACAQPQPASVLALPQFRGQLAANEELLTLETRPGVTTRVFVTKPAGAPRGVFVHYPGGNGILRGPRTYVPMRRELATLGYVVAVADVPSDQPLGLEGQEGVLERFRVHPDHTRDARAVIDNLTARWLTPVYLMGHSMGTISATHIAASLDDRRLAGLVLLGSTTERGPQASWVSLPSARLDRVSVPVVLTHHRDDGCRGATFVTARTYPRMFRASPRVGFIEVTGGHNVPGAHPIPCKGEFSYHNFSGLEAEVMRAVVRWLNGEDVRHLDG